MMVGAIHVDNVCARNESMQQVFMGLSLLLVPWRLRLLLLLLSIALLGFFP